MKDYLTEKGRILIFFGTSGDIDYLYKLIDDAGFTKETINHSKHEKDGINVEYYTLLLSR